MKWVLVIAGFVAIALVSAGVVWAVLSASGPQSSGQPRAIEPAVESSPAADDVPTPPAQPEAGPETTASSTGPSSQAGSVTGAAELVAFRKGGMLHVGPATGAEQAAVARSDAGPYALSPDGRVLAHVTDGRLWLVTLDGASKVDVGPASGEDPGAGACPMWSPDSRYLYFTRMAGDDAEVWRVAVDGRDPRRIMPGSCPSVSPDGRVIAAIDPGGGVIVSIGGATPRRISVAPAVAVAVAAGDQELYVAVIDAAGESAIERMPVSGSRRSQLMGSPVDAPRATWGVLRLSPDGTHLAAAAVGDDRYSRLSIIEVTSGRILPVGGRRDAYMRYWSADGRRLYYVEGNAYQGESTRLMRVESAGVGRALVVDGAE